VLNKCQGGAGRTHLRIFLFFELERCDKNVSAKENSETGQSMSLLPAFSITLSRHAEQPGIQVGEDEV